MKYLLSTVAAGALAFAASVDAARAYGDNHAVRHVLLISIDGMHALDYINCASGTKPTCPNLAPSRRQASIISTRRRQSPPTHFRGLRQS